MKSLHSVTKPVTTAKVYTCSEVAVTIEHSLPWKPSICGVPQELSGRVPRIQKSQWMILDQVWGLYHGLNGTLNGGEL